MDEHLFYIQEHITGLWHNPDYSFHIRANPNVVDFMNHQRNPRGGQTGQFMIVRSEPYYLLRLLFPGTPIINTDYQIKSINGADKTMTLSNDGVDIELNKVSV